MEKEEYILHSSEFLGAPPHSMIVSQAGTQYSVRISPETLVGTDFHSRYNDLLAQTKENERDENGLPKHPFQLLDIYKALQRLVWNTCKAVSETHADPKPPSTPPGTSLQDYIQPPTLHLTLAKNAHSSNGVVATVVGDSSSNEYPWATAHTAQTARQITNSYSFDLAPIATKDLFLGSTAADTFQASELFVTRKTTPEAVGSMQMQQVHTLTERGCFFKPRFDLMAPEFDREVAVLEAIRRSGLDRTLRVSPFKGLVLLDDGLVTGMLFEWLDGWPLAEYPELADRRLHERWREQVEGIVRELHRCGIVWGDVNVHNIFIDANGDAWVIDFGGNCNVEFVDEELKETHEGDIQGLRRVFEEWLPAMAGKS